MDEIDRDTLRRTAAFQHIRRLSDEHDHSTATEFKPGIMFQAKHIRLSNPQPGTFQPRETGCCVSPRPTHWMKPTPGRAKMRDASDPFVQPDGPVCLTDDSAGLATVQWWRA